MTEYDPAVAPDPAEWLALDEAQRLSLVEAYHCEGAGKLPSVKAHILFHIIVENQIAEGLQSTVRTMNRLMNEGMSRHDALHAIGTVVATQLHAAMNSKDDREAEAQERFDAAVERLSAREWMRKY